MSVEQRITDLVGQLVLSKPSIVGSELLTVHFRNARKEEGVDVAFLSGPLSGTKITIPAGVTVSLEVSSSATYRVSGATVQPVDGDITINP